MWGNLSNLGQWGKKIHVSPFFVYPTTSIEEWLLVVEAVNCFGSGVAGLSVLTHTHTPLADWTSRWAKEWRGGILMDVCLSSRIISIVRFFSRTGSWRFGLTQKFSSLHDGAEDSRTSNFTSSMWSVRSPPLPICYSLTHRIFLVLTHSFSSADLRMVWLRPLLTGWFVGSALWMFMHRLGNCKFVPSMVYVHFSPAASIV